MRVKIRRLRGEFRVIRRKGRPAWHDIEKLIRGVGGRMTTVNESTALSVSFDLATTRRCQLSSAVAT